MLPFFRAMSRVVRCTPYAFGERVAGSAPKVLALPPGAGFAQVAEFTRSAFPTLDKARLYVHVVPESGGDAESCEVATETEWIGALSLAEAFAPNAKARHAAKPTARLLC